MTALPRAAPMRILIALLKIKIRPVKTILTCGIYYAMKQENLVSTLSTHNKDMKQSQNIPDKIKSQQL
ncbi:MAG: hypothetical protein KL787_07550 [Taibaiella sp.]|nr:hypothetical protein [Taibaiella sp.]